MNADNYHMLEELLAKRDAEIERLKSVIEDLSDHNCAAERMELIKQQGDEIERLRDEVTTWKGMFTELVKLSERKNSLLARAADTLEGGICVPEDWGGLIAKLREAAQ